MLPIGGPAETVHALDRTAGLVGVVGRFDIGAPVAAVVVEELIALGAQEVVTLGDSERLARQLWATFHAAVDCLSSPSPS